MPQPGPYLGGRGPAVGSLSWTFLVGRDGIEPPTLRFSVAGLGVQQWAGLVTVLVSWHVAKQAWASFGRVLVDRDVDRTC
jgi:hypothetical protein